MANYPESWHHIAHVLGYENEEEMLKDLYVKQRFSLSDLARKLGYSQGCVRRRLITLGVPLNARGGKNRKGMTMLKAFKDEELVDAKKVAAETGLHISTVFGEKRRRKKNAIPNDSAVGVPEETQA